MATVEFEAPTTEQPPTAVEEEEEKKPQEEEAPVEEKKQKAPPKEKKKKPKQSKAASHPPYFQMIKEAIVALNDKSGSSPYAIAKYMEEKHKAELPANFRKIMALQLKNSAAKGKLIKVKASYKLSGATKRDKNPPVAPKTRAATKAKAEKKPAAAEKKKKKKKMKKVPTGKPAEASSKKVGTKRTRKAAAAAKPKQPKSIKSPAVRKTKRVRVSAI